MRPASLLLALLLLPLDPHTTVAGQSNVDLSGSWTLDTYLSDSPERVARALAVDTGESVPGRSGRGTEPIGPEGDGPDRGGSNRRGGFGRGGGSARGPGSDPIGGDDRKTLNELTDAVRFPPTALTISQSGTDFTIAPAAGMHVVLRTDGGTEQQTLDGRTVDRRARWEGPLLLVTYRVGHAGDLTYRYSLVPTTGQLLVRINFERLPDEPGPFDIKLVYNRDKSAGGPR